ncbi:MAG: VOC family protein [Actinomycetota bacterium]
MTDGERAWIDPIGLVAVPIGGRQRRHDDRTPPASELSEAVAFLTEVLGWEVAHRGPAGHAPGEIAVLDGGSIAVSLFEPARDVAGAVADPSARVTQLILGGTEDVTRATEQAVVSAGLPLHREGIHSFVPPEAMSGVLGVSLAVSLRTVMETE